MKFSNHFSSIFQAVSSLFSKVDLLYTYTSLMSREVGGVCRVRKNLPPWYSSFSAFLLPAFHFYNNQITLKNYMNIESTHSHVFRSKIKYTFHVKFYLLFLYQHHIFTFRNQCMLLKCKIFFFSKLVMNTNRLKVYKILTKFQN